MASQQSGVPQDQQTGGFVMEWWPIAGFLIFLTGLVIVAIQAIRNGEKEDDKPDESTRS